MKLHSVKMRWILPAITIFFCSCGRIEFADNDIVLGLNKLFGDDSTWAVHQVQDKDSEFAPDVVFRKIDDSIDFPEGLLILKQSKKVKECGTVITYSLNAIHKAYDVKFDPDDSVEFERLGRTLKLESGELLICVFIINNHMYGSGVDVSSY